MRARTIQYTTIVLWRRSCRERVLYKHYKHYHRCCLSFSIQFACDKIVGVTANIASYIRCVCLCLYMCNFWNEGGHHFFHFFFCFFFCFTLHNFISTNTDIDIIEPQQKHVKSSKKQQEEKKNEETE